MKTSHLVFGILLLVCIHGKVHSQIALDTNLISKINNTSVTAINFDDYSLANMEAIELHAWMAFAQKDYEKAAKYYLFIIRNNMDDATSLYSLSCCYAGLNYPELAGYFLIMSINAGFNDFYRLRNEEIFNAVKNDPYFKNTYNQAISYGENFGETIYVEANVLIKSKVFLPKNYNSQNSYKLLVGLHGYGGNCENFSGIHDYIDNEEVIFVVPEAPYLKNATGKKNLQYSWDFQIRDEDLWKKSDPSVIEYIMNVVDYMNSHYNIDKNYILGFSQGAAYAYCTGIKNSKKIDGIVAIGGRLPDSSKFPWILSEEDVQDGNNLNVFIAHGKDDNAINYKSSMDAKKRLKKQNYNVELSLFQGGHLVTSETVTEALNWLFQQEVITN